jgi:hypothetical protein
MSDPEDKKAMTEIAEKYERVAARAFEHMSADRSTS